jgi:hypothetical protein
MHLPFHQWLKMVLCNLLLPLAHVYLSPSKMFFDQQMVWHQHFMLEHLQHNTFFNMLSNDGPNVYWTHILSCSCLSMGAQFCNSTYLLNVFDVFCKFFHNTSNLARIFHLSIVTFFQCIYTQPINPLGVHLL